MSPIHEAILFNDEIYLKLLLELGADPEQRGKRNGRYSDGMNASEFLDAIQSKRNIDMSSLKRLLEQYHRT
jgi:ankyrin repeat protein